MKGNFFQPSDLDLNQFTNVNPHSRHVRVGHSKLLDGERGVFALKDFDINEVVETCPVILVPDVEVRGTLKEYVFSSNVEEFSTVVLGYGMLYNHSSVPNTTWHIQKSNNIILYAKRKIRAGEELFHSYGEKWWQSRGKSPKNLETKRIR